MTLRFHIGLIVSNGSMLSNGSICIYFKKGTNVVIFLKEFEKNV